MHARPRGDGCEGPAAASSCQDAPADEYRHRSAREVIEANVAS